MTFNPSVHNNILFQLLKDIYSDSALSSSLGFKGGTAAYVFYKLDRFSVDLDFDLLDINKEDFVFEKIADISKKYGKIIDAKKKRFNLLLVFSYEPDARHVKIEISRRKSDSHYELKTYLGVSMLVIQKPDMFANKLIAMSERIGKTSRDIYDVWFFLKNNWPINKDIVEKRTGKSLKTLIKKDILLLEKMSNRRILEGTGELLTTRQKDWAKAKLREDTIFLLKLMLKK